MLLGLFQIAGLVRDDVEICMSSDFIPFETESFLKRIARWRDIATIKRSQTLINELLPLVEPVPQKGT